MSILSIGAEYKSKENQSVTLTLRSICHRRRRGGKNPDEFLIYVLITAGKFDCKISL